MYEIHPPAVYIHERAVATPEGRARVDRMLTHVHCPEEPETVDDRRLNEISASNDWLGKQGLRTGQWELTGDPVLVFNAFAWDAGPERSSMAGAERYVRMPGSSIRHTAVSIGATTATSATF